MRIQTPHPPPEVYRSYLAQSDVFIGLYWQRYGALADGLDVSGLEDEYDLSRHLPRLLYVKAPALDRDDRLADLLLRMAREASYRVFRSATELGRLVRDDLATLLSERFAASGSASRRASPQALPHEPGRSRWRSSIRRRPRVELGVHGGLSATGDQD